MSWQEKIILGTLVTALVAVFSRQELKLAESRRVVFCDVGQGDGALINLHNTQIIIDGGPDKTILSCLGKYMPYFDRRIEYLIISHPDKDHFLGAVEILRRYDVERVIINGDSSDIPEYAEFLKLSADKIAVVYPDSDFNIGEAKIDFLYPYTLARETKDNNNNSLVFRFEYNAMRINECMRMPRIDAKKECGVSILFTGDLPEKGEAELVKNNANLRADILKISHHGSKFSSSKKFLEAVSPRLAVISAGRDNKYGHPHYAVIKRLENLGVKYLRTDEAGDIVINFQ